MTRLTLQKSYWEQVKHHIQSSPEREVCGLMGGVWRPYPLHANVHQVVPIHNIDAFPHVRFTMSPSEQLAAMLAFDKQGWEVVGIYHSHPTGEAKPSLSDIAEASYPDAVYVIGTPLGEMTAWRITKGGVIPVEIHLLEG